MLGLLYLSFVEILAASPEGVRFEKTVVITIPDTDSLKFSTDIKLDDLKLTSCSQLYLTPIITDEFGNSDSLPSVLINGRGMQIAWERGTVKAPSDLKNRIYTAVRRTNDKPQTVFYNMSVPVQKWMWGSSASVKWMADSCGCGRRSEKIDGIGGMLLAETPLGLNIADRMRVAYIVPPLVPAPVITHQGNARVQYEVNQSLLHTEPYVCRDGQIIDNRVELRIIDDSISNALSDKNLEIAKISICGYASPDGSYTRNEWLSNDRSRSLANYIADRYNLPSEKSEFTAVAENWEGFRRIVAEDNYLTEQQRSELLRIIDIPTYGAADYDEKEEKLKTNPLLKELYYSVILPEWFPTLRNTRFEIQTRLKELTDDELAEVIKTDPEKMSLNQMFRVARLYPEGSKEYNDVVITMLEFYPDDETANLNAASAALKTGDLKKASEYLKKSGTSPEAENARGILACWNGDIDEAREYFRKAAKLPEAAKNLEMLGK